MFFALGVRLLVLYDLRVGGDVFRRIIFYNVSIAD